MALMRPALWWPIQRNSAANAAQNTYVEFWIRTGAGPYTYYPGAVGAEPATGYIVNLSTQNATLDYPYGYDAWRTIYRFCAALETAMEAVSSPPASFGVSWSISAAGLLTLTASSADAGTAIRFEWGGATAPATSYLAVAEILGFDVDVATYATAITAVRQHACGFYLASDDGAALTKHSGAYTSDVQVYESISIYGQMAGASIGGVSRTDLGLGYLSADQREALLQMHAYAVEGGGMAYHGDGVLWADFPLGYSLARQSRERFAPERVAPGVPRWNAEISLVQRS